MHELAHTDLRYSCMNGKRLSTQLKIFRAFVGERKGAKNISSHTVIYLGTAN